MSIAYFGGYAAAADKKSSATMTGSVVAEPVKVVAKTTGKIVKDSFESPQNIVFDSLENIKDGTNEILPEGMEFVGNDPDSEGNDAGPKIKMNF